MMAAMEQKVQGDAPIATGLCMEDEPVQGVLNQLPEQQTQGNKGHCS